MLVVAILCFVGVLVAYKVGAASGKAWGVPIMILCTLGLVGSLAARFVLPSGRTGAGLPTVALQTEQEHARLVGEGLAGYVTEGAAFVVVGIEPEDSDKIAEKKVAWEAGLREGLGDDTVTVALYRKPVDDFYDALDGVADTCQALLALDGFEPSAEVATLLQGMPVGAYFPARRDGRPSVGVKALSDWIKGGALQAAVVQEGQANTTYTPESLP